MNQELLVASLRFPQIYKYFTAETKMSFAVEFQQHMNHNFCSINIFLRQSALPDMINLKNNDDYAFCEFAYQEVKVCRVGILNPIVDTWYYLLVRSNCLYKLKIKGPDYNCLQRYGKIKEYQSEYLVILLIIPLIFNKSSCKFFK
jgi:hypothetical protein